MGGGGHLATSDRIVIDGAQGSGSGTIVRTAVALAGLLGRPLHIYNVRAARKNPGLRQQHLGAVEAVARLTGGRLRGAAVGARAFDFEPSGRISGGEYFFDLGAGSATLVAYTVLPVAAFADGPTVFRIRGGTFQDFAPSAYHFKYVLLTLLGRMGVRAELEVLRPGYVPSGGGLIELRVWPARPPLRPLSLLEPGRVVRVWGLAVSSHLRSRRVSDRMAARCRARLKSAGLDAEIEVVYDESAAQAGAGLAVFAETDTGCIFGADRSGELRRSSEEIGDYVAETLLADLRSGATVDRHLADQLVLFGALADGETRYIVPQVTDHLETACWLAGEILGAEAVIDGRTIRIRGVAFRKPD
jgi:RNA 3'-terminal phosphate cyclase (ATP)